MHEDWRDMYIAQKIITLHSWATQLEKFEVQPLSPSLWIQTLEQTYFVYCVVLVRIGLFQMQTAEVTVYGSTIEMWPWICQLGVVTL